VLVHLPRSGGHPDLAQDDAEADRQFRASVDGVQSRLTQEREQVVAVSPQVLGQALVGRVRLGRDDQVRHLVLQAALGPINPQFLHLKRLEWNDYHRQVSAWEVERYLTML
jgi:glutamine synthetase